ncbi:MAG: arsenic resistance N-acetyltransferase ArsN2 [Nitrospirota bacterium]
MDVVQAGPEDLEAVLALLRGSALPTEGVAEHFCGFLVARAGGAVAGCAGQEGYSSNVLLRSLAVAPAYRGRGLGRALTRRIIEQARENGASRVYLLTETAGDFFLKFGFCRIPREKAESAIGASAEFRSICCQSAACMRLVLRHRPPG